jgi:hypothetical protein
MTKRLLTTALAAITAAALASSATAAITSTKLYVSAATQSAGAPGLKLKLTKAQTDGDLARVLVYVPVGYTLNTTQAVGTQLGTAAATLLERDLGTVAPVTGTVEVANPVDLDAGAIACTGSAAHTQDWVVRLQAGTTPLSFPAFVDLVPAATPLAAFAAATVTVCLPPSDLPAGAPGRAPLGASLLTAELTTSSISNPAARGEYRWRAVATPFQPATGQRDSAAAVEIQSLLDLPTTLSLRAKTARSGKRGVSQIAYGGSLLSNGGGVGSATVELYKGATQAALKKLKSQTTADNGAYKGSFAVEQGPAAQRLVLLAKARTADQDLGAAACTATFVPPLSATPLPCVDAAVAGVAVTGPTVRVTVPRGPKTKR